MCKEMTVIPVDGVVDKKKNSRKKWRAEEEERHKGSPTHKNLVPEFRRGLVALVESFVFPPPEVVEKVWRDGRRKRRKMLRRARTS
jgi:hypothetical protein